MFQLIENREAAKPKFSDPFAHFGDRHRIAYPNYRRAVSLALRLVKLPALSRERESHFTHRVAMACQPVMCSRQRNISRSAECQTNWSTLRRAFSLFLSQHAGDAKRPGGHSVCGSALGVFKGQPEEAYALVAVALVSFLLIILFLSRPAFV